MASSPAAPGAPARVGALSDGASGAPASSATPEGAASLRPRADAPDTPAPPYTPWVPIRSLAPRHRERIVGHLMALDERDRYLRFGHAASDAQIQRYAESLDFDRDEVFGIFNRRLELIAMAHLAMPRPHTPMGHAAEFGVSVLGKARGRGHGGRLFEHAMLHARNRGLDTLFIHALSENGPMLRIARRAGAQVQRAGGEAEAVLKLPPETMASHVEQWVGEGAAALDYRLKQQSLVVNRVLEMIGEVRAGLGDHPGKAARD